MLHAEQQHRRRGLSEAAQPKLTLVVQEAAVTMWSLVALYRSFREGGGKREARGGGMGVEESTDRLPGGRLQASSADLPSSPQLTWLMPYTMFSTGAGSFTGADTTTFLQPCGGGGEGSGRRGMH